MGRPIEVPWHENYIPEPNSGCFIWLGALNKEGGYGRTSQGARSDGRPRNRRVHRLMYEKEIGPIPDGLDVLHRCDNPVCVNPEHLFLGTHADNMKDCADKGRLPDRRGQKAPNAKLTADQVTAIRASTRSQRAIAKDFGITQAAVSLIKTGRTWR